MPKIKLNVINYKDDDGEYKSIPAFVGHVDKNEIKTITDTYLNSNSVLNQIAQNKKDIEILVNSVDYIDNYDLIAMIEEVLK